MRHRPGDSFGAEAVGSPESVFEAGKCSRARRRAPAWRCRCGSSDGTEAARGCNRRRGRVTPPPDEGARFQPRLRLAVVIVPRGIRRSWERRRGGGCSASRGSRSLESERVPQGQAKPVAPPRRPCRSQIDTNGSRLPSSHSTRPWPLPVSMTPESVYRQARSSVTRSPHDIPSPAVSLQVNPVRRVPGTMVIVLGNVMRVSPLATRAAPMPPPTNGLNGREIDIRGQDPRQRGQIRGH